jgi:AbrB family looped-hinge helix DNA binding protein
MGTIYLGTLDIRGRVTLPLELRRQLGLSAGDRIEFLVEDSQVVIRHSNAATRVLNKNEHLNEFRRAKKR